MDDQSKTNLTSSEHWTRFIYMLLFSFFLYIASILAVVIVVAQFIFALVTGGANTRLREFGGEVVTYINQVWMFLTYNSEEKAYPFADWPTVATTAIKPEPVTEPAATEVADDTAALVERADADVEPTAQAEGAEPKAEDALNADPQAHTEEAEEERKPEKLEP